jgi:hypothetical protein
VIEQHLDRAALEALSVEQLHMVGIDELSISCQMPILVLLYSTQGLESPSFSEHQALCSTNDPICCVWIANCATWKLGLHRWVSPWAKRCGCTHWPKCLRARSQSRQRRTQMSSPVMPHSSPRGDLRTVRWVMSSNCGQSTKEIGNINQFNHVLILHALSKKLSLVYPSSRVPCKGRT